MSVSDWHDAANHAFAGLILIAQEDSADATTGSPRILIAFNPQPHVVAFVLPEGPWQVAIDSSGERVAGTLLAEGQPLAAPARALVVVRSDRP
jgi:glycogen operon protein